MKENQQFEWKETWRDEFLRWICGFANAGGCSLHIGRNDKGVVVGLPAAGKLLEVIRMWECALARQRAARTSEGIYDLKATDFAGLGMNHEGL